MLGRRALGTLLCTVLGMQAGWAADGWSASGDFRTGFFASERDARDRETIREDDGRARLRLAADRHLGAMWRWRGRVAGSYSTEQSDSSFYLRGYAPTPTGVEPGDTTVDELYLAYIPTVSGMSVRFGRFQTGFLLTGVASKSLDRNDSSNVGVTWTDGVHLQASVTPGWRAHIVVQHNHRKGPTTTARPPLDFTDSGSRASLFAALDGTDPWGPLIQRTVSLAWLPDSLAARGTFDDHRKDYVAATAKLAAAWPVGDRGMRLVAGGEGGYAPETPRGAVVGTGESGRSDGTAWQISASLYDMAPGHNLGLVYGRAGGGWLISTDFRNNDELAEVRYQWRFTARWSMEARYRVREELKVPGSAERKRRDQDIYIRLSGRF